MPPAAASVGSRGRMPRESGTCSLPDAACAKVCKRATAFESGDGSPSQPQLFPSLGSTSAFISGQGCWIRAAGCHAWRAAFSDQTCRSAKGTLPATLSRPLLSVRSSAAAVSCSLSASSPSIACCQRTRYKPGPGPTRACVLWPGACSVTEEPRAKCYVHILVFGYLAPELGAFECFCSTSSNLARDIAQQAGFIRSSAVFRSPDSGRLGSAAKLRQPRLLRTAITYAAWRIAFVAKRRRQWLAAF